METSVTDTKRTTFLSFLKKNVQAQVVEFADLQMRVGTLSLCLSKNRTVLILSVLQSIFWTVNKGVMVLPESRWDRIS